VAEKEWFMTLTRDRLGIDSPQGILAVRERFVQLTSCWFCKKVKYVVSAKKQLISTWRSIVLTVSFNKYSLFFLKEAANRSYIYFSFSAAKTTIN
jgi:hypothetical protein